MNYRSNVDYTTRDYEGFRNDLLELLKKKIPEYSDFSQSDMGVVLIELLAHGLDVLSYYNDRVANEVFPDTAVERESIIKHCRRLGYELKNSTPSRFYQVFKIHPQPHDYVIPRGLKLKTSGEELVEFELIEDLIIPKGCNGLEKDEKGNYLYKALVEHGSSVYADIIGTSNGTPYQNFTLSYYPIIIDSLQVFVRSEYDIEEWERVNNFIDSDISSKQYMIEVTENDYVKVLFGSGYSGMIPPIYDNGLSANYRVGGGIVGNVSLNSITEITSKPAVIIETMNVEQVQVGTDKETIEEAKFHAPLSLRTLWRAVTLVDYENLLIQEFPHDVKQVKAVAEEDRYTISLYVLTTSVKEDLPKDLKEKFLTFLDERKEIGYNLQMKAPTYEDITLNVNVTTTRAYQNSDVKDSVASYLAQKFEKGNMSFGEPLIKSQITGELMSLMGVHDLDITTQGNINPPNHKIINVNTINVNVVGGV